MEHWKGEKPICALTGSVISGFGLGKHVGTPTANLCPGPGTTLPEPGVYTSKAVLEGCAHLIGIQHGLPHGQKRQRL